MDPKSLGKGTAHSGYFLLSWDKEGPWVPVTRCQREGPVRISYAHLRQNGMRKSSVGSGVGIHVVSEVEPLPC